MACAEVLDPHERVAGDGEDEEESVVDGRGAREAGAAHERHGASFPPKDAASRRGLQRHHVALGVGGRGVESVDSETHLAGKAPLVACEDAAGAAGAAPKIQRENALQTELEVVGGYVTQLMLLLLLLLAADLRRRRTDGPCEPKGLL